MSVNANDVLKWRVLKPQGRLMEGMQCEALLIWNGACRTLVHANHGKKLVGYTNTPGYLAIAFPVSFFLGDPRVVQSGLNLP